MPTRTRVSRRVAFGSLLVLPMAWTVFACGATDPAAVVLPAPAPAPSTPERTRFTAAPECVASPEVCDGIDNDCSGVADDGLVGCDPCAARLELPVVTHYSKSLGRREELGTDQADVYAPYDTSKPYVPGACYPYYAGGRQPDLDQYIGDTWSTNAISDSYATKHFDDLCRSTGMPFRFLRPDAVDTDRISSQGGAVQVVHALVVDGSLVTVVLPSNWSKKAPAGGYPILFNGYYDLNENVFQDAGEGRELERKIAESTAGGKTGAIGVLWNGGGGLAGRTLNPRAQDQFAEVIKYVARVFSGDPQRIVMFGTSRGGATAVMMASNPKNYPYRVTYIAAAVPATRAGEHSTLASATYPALLGGQTWTIGLHDSWRPGWTFPSCAGKPHLTGKTAEQAHLYLLTGATDPNVADQTIAAVSNDAVAGIKRAGTEVYLEVSSHDSIVPYAHQVEYGLKLIRAGVPVEAEVFVRAGHFRRQPLAKAWDALQVYIDPALAGQRPTVKPGLSYFRVNRNALPQTDTLEAFSPPDGQFPFTLEGPRFSVLGSRFPLVMVGAPGTSWEVTLGLPGSAPFVWTGTLSDSMRAIQWVDVAPATPLGNYVYGLRIKKPGSDWQVIPSTNTIDGSAGVVTLVDSVPNVDGTGITNATKAPAISPHFGTNWGLSEY